MYGRMLAVLVVVVLLAIFAVVMPANSQGLPDVTLIVSEIRGSPGEVRLVPIYVKGEIDQFNITGISFDLVYDSKIVTFTNLYTPYDTILWQADEGYFEEFTRLSKVTAVFSDTSPFTGENKLFNAEFAVGGHKGAVGEIGIENLKLTAEFTPTVGVISAEFRVLPTAEHLADRSFIEITSRDVFTSFEMEIYGDFYLTAGAIDSGWFISAEGNGIISGLSPDPSAGITALNVPIFSDNQPVEIYSLTLGSEKVVLQRRKLLLPYAIK